MHKVCPVCNSLITINEYCPECELGMTDGGPIENYIGPYSPYMEFNASEYCVHLLYCNNCHYDTRVAFELVFI